MYAMVCNIEKCSAGTEKCCTSCCSCCLSPQTASVVSLAGMSSKTWAAGDWQVHLERILEYYSSETQQGVPLPSNLSMNREGMSAEQLTKKKLTKLRSIVIRYVKTEDLPAVHLTSATLVIHPSEPVAKIMKFVSLLNGVVDGVQTQVSCRPKDWVRTDDDDAKGRGLSMGMGMPAWGGFGNKKKTPTNQDDEDGQQAAPAQSMER